MSGTNSLKMLLDIYQQSRKNGEWASLKMETKDGKEMITFTIGSPSAGNSAETWNPELNQSKRRKTPCNQRRDERRKAAFIAKKAAESQETTLKDKPSDDPVKGVHVEPKVEINLEEPEVTIEKEVNYVGEYVYDTKLQNDEIHKTIWNTLQNSFKEGVEEFLDGSTCNEKIVAFWGKCKFKEGFDENYILDKKNWPNGMKKMEIEEPG